MFFLKGRGTLEGEGKKRKKEGKVNNSSKNAYGAELFCLDHHSNERPQNYRLLTSGKCQSGQEDG